MEPGGPAVMPVACSSCGRALDRTKLGRLCKPCTFAAGLSTSRNEFIGEYETLYQLEEGGMATVHVAKKPHEEEPVAIKMPKAEVIERVGGAALFREEIQKASSLRHPNIVRVEASGTHDGKPFFVMPLLAGTLADDERRRAHRQPERAVGLMIKIARAIQFAHQKPVLHCDLKPSNILMDAEGEPYVSDFGLARIGLKNSTSGRTAYGGTPGWMSPEQASEQPLETTSDVFCLGLMLSWLLTGRPAFGDGRDFKKRVTTEEHVAPGRWLPSLKWALDAIAHRALQRDPKGRYQTAAAFADDLERARDGLPIACEERLLFRKAVKWVRRHRILAAAAIELVLLLLYLPLIPLSVLGELRSTMLQRNMSFATAQAGAVMNELRSFAERVEKMATNPNIQALVAHDDLYHPPAALATAGSEFDLAFVLDATGTLRARWPDPGSYRYPGRDFRFRDYFACQKSLADAKAHGAARPKPEVCISRAFHNVIDRYMHIAFSVPLFDPQGNYTGGLVATRRVRSTFGAVQMNCSGGGDCMTALLGPRDRDGPNEALPGAICILAEPGLPEHTEMSLPAALSSTICSRFGCNRSLELQFEPRLDRPLVLERYDDPVSRAQSLAALAPVGHTALVVLVATPNSAVDALRNKLMSMTASSLWVPGIFGLLVLVALLLGPRVAARTRWLLGRTLD
jgi:hypothetical protein